MFCLGDALESFTAFENSIWVDGFGIKLGAFALKGRMILRSVDFELTLEIIVKDYNRVKSHQSYAS